MCTVIMHAVKGGLSRYWQIVNQIVYFSEICMFNTDFSLVGSGSLAAMATFEDRFKPDMTVS